MKHCIFICFILFSIILNSGCNNTAKLYNTLLAKYPKEFEYIRFIKGREAEHFSIKKGDEPYDHLYEWIVKTKEGWNSDLITYAPQHLFSSKEMNINVMKNFIVINFSPESGKWVQISHACNGIFQRD